MCMYLENIQHNLYKFIYYYLFVLIKIFNWTLCSFMYYNGDSNRMGIIIMFNF